MAYYEFKKGNPAFIPDFKAFLLGTPPPGSSFWKDSIMSDIILPIAFLHTLLSDHSSKYSTEEKQIDSGKVAR